MKRVTAPRPILPTAVEALAKHLHPLPNRVKAKANIARGETVAKKTAKKESSKKAAPSNLLDLVKSAEEKTSEKAKEAAAINLPLLDPVV